MQKTLGLCSGLLQVERLRPDGFTPNIVDQKEDYLYVEYESPTFGVSGWAGLAFVKYSGWGWELESCGVSFLLTLFPSVNHILDLCHEGEQ